MRKTAELITLPQNLYIFYQEKERAKDLEAASKFCENLCNDFVSIASSSESAGGSFQKILFKPFKIPPCWKTQWAFFTEPAE